MAAFPPFLSLHRPLLRRKYVMALCVCVRSQTDHASSNAVFCSGRPARNDIECSSVYGPVTSPVTMLVRSFAVCELEGPRQQAHFVVSRRCPVPSAGGAHRSDLQTHNLSQCGSAFLPSFLGVRRDALPCMAISPEKYSGCAGPTQACVSRVGRPPSARAPPSGGALLV